MLKKLLSRKFLLAAGALILETVGVNIPTEVLTLAAVYVGGEAVADAAGAWKAR